MSRSAGSAHGGSAPEPATAPARTWVERHPLAAHLETLDPGSDLVAALMPLGPADLDEEALIEGIAAWDRIGSFVAARQAELVAEATRRAGGSQVEFLSDEIASRLSVSRRAAEVLIERATGLEVFPAVHDALATGAVNVPKVDVLLRETRHLRDDDARGLVAHVLQQAPELTAPQVRAAVRRAEAKIDPEAAVERHGRAREERCVRMTPAPDAMAWVTAFMPATDAMTVMTALDAMAASASPQDERPLSARRADGLTDVMRQILDSGVGPQGPLPTNQRRRPHLAVTISHTALSSGRGVAELAGYGPIPAAVAREVAAEATWRAFGLNPFTGEVAAMSAKTYRPSTGLANLVTMRDVTCTFPGCRIPAVRCDIDHIEPFDPTRPASAQTRCTNLHSLCRHHHRLKTLGRWTVTQDDISGTTRWQAPTGHLHNRDPVPADPDWEPPPRRRPPPTIDPDDPVGDRRVKPDVVRPEPERRPTPPHGDDDAPPF